MEYYGATDIGRYRAENQDFFSITEILDGALLAVVCDGMGGAAGGKIASELAANVFSEFVEKKIYEHFQKTSEISDKDLSIIEQILTEAINASNEAVFNHAKDSIDLIGMGTTLVAALIINDCAYICNVGDSRLYHLTVSQMKQITRDHSYVQMLIDNGLLLPELAEAHPDKNVITRAIGTKAWVKGEIFVTKLSKNEAFLLCSDGLSNFVTNEMIYSVVWGSDRIFAKKADEKVRELIALANNNGGRDNITAVLITY